MIGQTFIADPDILWENTMEMVIVIVIAPICLAIVGLIGTVFLRKAAKGIESLDVPFGEVYATVFISWLIGMGIGSLLVLLARTLGLLINYDMANSLVGFRANMIVLVSVICWLVQAGAICWRFSVTFGKALLISLVPVIISTAISIGIVALIAFGILFYSFQGWH
jgi:ABC-type glycerol-3-phosphate transport system permease component